MKLSPYVKVIKVSESDFDSEHSDDIILYNKYNGALYHMKHSELSDFIKSLKRNEKISDRKFKDLVEYDFFVTVPKIPKCTRNSDSFLITIELSRQCNLNCRYCYQNNLNQCLSNLPVSNNTLDHILNYIENVFMQSQLHLNIGYIGGEPLIHKKKIIDFSNRVNSLCERYNREVHYHIDTNGTIDFQDIYEILEFSNFSITLSLPEDHNKNRPSKYKNKNSFDLIVENISKIRRLDNRTISIRYNTNDNNIMNFEEFVRYCKDHLPICTVIEPMYTDNYEYNKDFENKLSIDRFRKWNSTKAIDILLRNGYEVNYSLSSDCLSMCIAYQPYSCKIHADGIVTLCDAMPETMSKLLITDISSNPDVLERYFYQYKAYDPTEDEECRKCVDLVRCKGKLFCRQYDIMSICDFDKRFNEEELIKTYFKYYRHKENKFSI